MSEGDLDTVAAMERTLYEFPWSRGQLRRFADRRLQHLDLAPGAMSLVGYAVMMVVLDEAHLLNISIHRDWQRRGYGRLLLRTISIGRAPRRRNVHIPGGAPVQRSGARLVRSGNFRLIGVRRGYYPAAPGAGRTRWC